MKNAHLILSMAMLALALADAGNGEDGPEEQQFLFMTEEAYTQARGEWQAGFTSRYMDGRKSREIEYDAGEKEETLSITDEWQGVTEIEYGLTDWFEIEAAVPVVSIDQASTKDGEDGSTATSLEGTGVGDIEAGFGVRLTEEDEDGWRPASKFAFEVTFPTGDWERGRGAGAYGFEAGFALSKIIGDFVLHANVKAGLTEDAREPGEDVRVDETETEGGLALVYRPDPKTDVIGEFSFEYETENVTDGKNYATRLYFTPGIKRELFEGCEAGLGTPVGLTYESADWGVITKILYEW